MTINALAHQEMLKALKRWRARQAARKRVKVKEPAVGREIRATAAGSPGGKIPIQRMLWQRAVRREKVATVAKAARQRVEMGTGQSRTVQQTLLWKGCVRERRQGV